MGSYSFSRTERIRAKSEFQTLKTRGLVFKTRQLLFNFLPGHPHTRLGLVVTRKTGGAVQRNKIKRWLREAFRLNKAHFELPLDLVIVPRSEASSYSYRDIVRDFAFFVRWYNEKVARRPH